MFWEGVCEECGDVVEFQSSREEKDKERTHAECEAGSQCQGILKRVPFPRSFAVKWHYGKYDKKGCFMGPSKNIYKTDTTEKVRRSKTATVTGPSYKGAVHKERA